MEQQRILNETQQSSPASRKRASWFGVFGGAAVALATSIVLGVLGLAVGATTIDPATDGSPSASSLATGGGIWLVATGILALFAGGWATGRLAGLRENVARAVHGVVTWSVFTVLSVALMFSAAGAIVNGALSVVGTTIQAAGQAVQGVASAVPSVDVTSKGVNVGGGEQVDATWQSILAEGQQLMRQTEAQQLQPSQIEQDVAEVQQGVKDAATAASPEASEKELQAALSDLRDAAASTAGAVDTRAVANVLEARTGMNQEEARQTAQRWGSQLQSVLQQGKETAQAVPAQIQQTAAQVGEDAADYVAAAAWWSFVYLLVTAVAAAGGALLGIPRTHSATTVRRRELGHGEPIGQT